MFLASASIVSLAGASERAPRPDVFSLLVSMDLASMRRYKDKARATNALTLLCNSYGLSIVRWRERERGNWKEPKHTQEMEGGGGRGRMRREISGFTFFSGLLECACRDCSDDNVSQCMTSRDDSRRWAINT